MNIIAAFVGYIIRIVLARNLSVMEYGLFFAVSTLIGFIGVFIGLGTGEALVKYVPYRKTFKSRYQYFRAGLKIFTRNTERDIGNVANTFEKLNLRTASGNQYLTLCLKSCNSNALSDNWGITTKIESWTAKAL